MTDQNELPVVAWREWVDGWQYTETPGSGQALTDHAAATARIAELEQQVREQALQYLASEGQWIEETDKLQQQVRELKADAARLDSGRILLFGIDHLGDETIVEHRGVDLRAAIDAAIAAMEAPHA